MRKIRPLIFLILSTCVLAASIVKFPTIYSSSSIILFISAVCGYIGITMLLWMYILGSRSVSKFLNKNYSQIIRLHNILGKYGLLFVFAHPILVSISYAESWLYSIIPNFTNEFNFYVTLGRIAFYALAAIWISSIILKSNIKYRPWKYIHLLSYAAIPFFLLHIPETGSSYASSFTTRFFYLFTVIGFIVFTIVRVYSWLGFDKKSYIVNFNKQIANKVFLISLTPNNLTDCLRNINDGKFIYIKFDKLFSENHPFSILHYDKQTGEILIAYKIYGKFTSELSHFSANQILKLSGPFGDFLADIKPDNQNVFIAGGIGVTPFVDFITNHPDTSHLIYFNHTTETAIFSKELSNILSNRLTNIFSVVDNHTVISRNQHPAALIKAINAQKINLKTAEFFISTQSSQVKSFVAKLKSAGVPADHVEFETFDF